MTVPTLHQPAGRQGQAPAARLQELDLLRALVAVGLVFFHTAVIWGAGEFPAKAASERQAVTVMLAFGASWGMPLLFLIPGMGAWYLLRSRTPGAFARERLRRLGLPLVAGLLTLVPPRLPARRRSRDGRGVPAALAAGGRRRAAGVPGRRRRPPPRPTRHRPAHRHGPLQPGPAPAQEPRRLAVGGGHPGRGPRPHRPPPRCTGLRPGQP
jgi:Acyltransferase family